MDPFKRKLFTMKYIVMLEWLKKCVINLHSVTAMFLLRIKISWTPSLCCLLFVLQIKLLILSTEGFHRGTIWLKVDNLAALATNLPTLCQKICHENAPYRPQIWVIRHWTTPMGRGSDWAISSAKKSETSLWHSILQVFLQYHSLTIANLPPVLSKQAMISRLPCWHQSPGWRLCHNRTQRH